MPRGLVKSDVIWGQCISWVKLPHGAKTASCPFFHSQRTRFLLCAAGHTFPPLRNNSLPRLTDQGLQKINDLAQHYGVSADAGDDIVAGPPEQQRHDGAV